MIVNTKLKNVWITSFSGILLTCLETACNVVVDTAFELLRKIV